MLSNAPCHWCGGTNDKTCLCHDCIDCGWHHDAGPPRNILRSFRNVRWTDGLVHVSRWERGIYTIPACWDGLNHVDPYPRGFEFETTLEQVNCLGCLAAS